MPFAYKSNGVFLGTLIILFAGLTAGYGLLLQGISSRFVPKGTASFFSLSSKTYPSLAVLFDVAIVIKCFGVGVSYIIIIGDLMPQIIESIGVSSSGVLLDRRLWVLISFGIVGPLCFLRKLDSLKYTSVVALISVGYLVLIVVGHFVLGDTLDERGPINLLEPDKLSSVLSSLPIIIFAFTCHQNMYSVLNELALPTDKNIEQVIGISVGSSGLLYILVGLCGYFSFGNNVGGNIISMYPFNIFSTIGRIAIVILVIFSYPLQCHPCRASLNHVIHWFSEKLKQKDQRLLDPSESSSGENDEHGTPFVPLETPKFIALTSVILILSLFTALSVTSLELMLAFVGSTGSTSISFILPGVFGYSLLGHADAEALTGFSGQTLSVLRKLSLGLTIWGFTVMTVCLGTNIWLYS